VIERPDGRNEPGNPQVAINPAGFGLTANSGNARIEGLEAELHALLG
jgi:hypothetical protein